MSYRMLSTKMQTVTSTESWNTTRKTDRISASSTPSYWYQIRSSWGTSMVIWSTLFFSIITSPCITAVHGRKSDLYFSELTCCTGQQIFVSSIYLFPFNLLSSEGYCCQSRLQWRWTKTRNKAPVCYSLLCHFHFRQSSCRIGEEPQTSRRLIRPRSGSQLEMSWLLL